MAVINKMRKSGWVFVVILAALALFVLSDFISTFQRGGGGMQDPEIGEIDGIKVHYNEYSEILKTREQNIAQNKQEGLNEDDRLQASTGAWDDLFRKYVVEEEYKKLGIEASNEELKEQLFGENPNQYVKQYFSDENGNFSSANVRNWYNQVYKTNPDAQLFFNSLKDAVVSGILGDKYSDIIAKGINATSFDALQDYLSQSNSVNGSIVGLQATSIGDDQVTYTEDELKTYYNKNKSKFSQKASRDLEFVSWSVVPSHYDSLDVKDEIKADIANFEEAENDSSFAALTSDRPVVAQFKHIEQYNQALGKFLINTHKGQVVGPYIHDGAYAIAKVVDFRESENFKYKYRSILIGKSWSDKQDSLTELAAARTFFEEMKSQPYSAIVYEANQKGYMVMGDENGEIQWMDGNYLDESFSKEIKNGKKGDYIFKTSSQGFHLIEIVENPNNYEYLVYEVYKNIEPSMNTINEAYAQASQFRSMLTDGKDGKFDKELEKTGFAKRIAKDILPSGSSIPGIEDSKEIIKWAFEDNRKVNDISDVIFADGRQTVFHISGIKNDGIASFESVKDEIISIVVKEKKLDIIVDKLNNAKLGKDNMVQIAIELGTIAHDFTNLSIKANSFREGNDELFVLGAILGLKPNVISSPIKGENGAYIINISEYSNPEIPDDLDDRKAMVNVQTFNQLEARIISALKVLADIKDDRNKHF